MSEISKIQVIIRKRPLNQKERQAQNEEDIIDIVSENSLIIKEKRKKVDLSTFIERHQFVFDNVFADNHDNEYIYGTVLNPLIEKVF
jgi:kinesin family protein 2/24